MVVAQSALFCSTSGFKESELEAGNNSKAAASR